MSNKNKIDPSLSRYVFFDMLYSELSYASDSKDIKKFKSILMSMKSSSVTQDEIDKSIFQSAYQLGNKGEDVAEELLKYLIFDYKIAETIYSSIIKNASNENLNMRIENMFTLRKLNETLGKELDTNNSVIKKVKL